MRFSVDAHAIGRHLTGNEVYVRNLLLGFAALDQTSDFIAYLSSDVNGAADVSIMGSGDGKTEETAFVVIGTDEEYTLFNFLGLRAGNQELIQSKGHSYDRMTVTDPKTNQTSVYFFNIDKPYNHLSKKFKN